MPRKALLSVAVLLQLLCIAAAQESPAQRVEARLKALFGDGAIPGVSAAVVMPGGEILTATAGWADREAQRAMTPEDRLMQGSVGKTYVAAVAMQLVSEGKLGLDEAISKHLGAEPWFERLPNAADITVRMLMNHTSGLVRYEFQPAFMRDLTARPERQWRPVQQLSYILDTEPPFAAGKGWEYSDTNYIVLGLIIEKVTNASYYDELGRRILEPHRLEATLPVTGRSVERLAQGYAGDQNPFGGQDRMLGDNGQMIINPQFEWTGGGIASTTSDLARWAKLLYEGKAFDPELLPVMLEGVEAPALGREAQYGLGVILRPTRLGPSYGHSGFFPGYMTEVMYMPEHRLAVAVQVNTSEFRKVRPPLSQWCLQLAKAALGVEAPATRP